MIRKNILLIGAVIVLLIVGAKLFFPAGNLPEAIPAEPNGVQQTQPSQPPEEILSSSVQSDRSSNELTGQVENKQDRNVQESVSVVPDAPHESAEEPPIEEKTETALKCMLTVRCDDVLNHMDTLAKGKETVIPPDGVIYKTQEVVFEQGESAFDVLLREMRKNQIHMEFVSTPMFPSVYIEGIGNLYEFDCGDCSGWMYAVNGVQPNYGCSQYILQHGDRVEFFYSCNWMDKTE